MSKTILRGTWLILYLTFLLRNFSNITWNDTTGNLNYDEILVWLEIIYFITIITWNSSSSFWKLLLILLCGCKTNIWSHAMGFLYPSFATAREICFPLSYDIPVCFFSKQLSHWSRCSFLFDHFFSMILLINRFFLLCVFHVLSHWGRLSISILFCL